MNRPELFYETNAELSCETVESLVRRVNIWAENVVPGMDANTHMLSNGLVGHSSPPPSHVNHGAHSFDPVEPPHGRQRTLLPKKAASQPNQLVTIDGRDTSAYIESRLTNALARATIAEMQVAAAEAQAIVAVRRAIKAEERAQDLEAWVATIEVRAIAAETQAIAAEAWTTKAEARATKAEARAHEQVIAANARADAWVAAANARATKAETRATKAETWAHEQIM